jgi:hypothetical protein
MALPSLALGIGLQGKYDYKQQANLQLARERGRAKAEADAANAAAKKRAPYEKRLLNIRGEGLLPVHAKAIREKVGEALTYFEENPEDYQGISQRIYDIDSSSKAYKNQSDLVKKTQSSSYLRGDADAVSGIMSSDDPDAIEEALSMNPSTGIRYDKASNNFAIAPTKYIDSKLRIDNILQKGGNSYYAPSEDAKVIDVNGKKFTTFQLNPQVPSLVLNEMLSGDNLASANDDYYSYLKSKRMALPDLRTPEGLAEWEGGRNKFLMDDITSEFEARGLIKDVTPRKGSTFNIFAGGELANAPENPTSAKTIPFGKEGKGQDYVNAYPGLPVTTDVQVTLANNTNIWDVETGKRIKESNVLKGTYNEPALVYKSKTAYNFPETKVKMQDGSYQILPARRFDANEPLRGGYALAMAKRGQAKAGYVAFGITKEGDYETKVIRNLEDVGIGEFLKAGKYKQTQLDEINAKAKEAKNKLQKEIESYFSAPAQEKPKGTPTPTPKPTPPTPKPAERLKSQQQNAKDVEKVTGVPLRIF